MPRSARQVARKALMSPRCRGAVFASYLFLRLCCGVHVVVRHGNAGSGGPLLLVSYGCVAVCGKLSGLARGEREGDRFLTTYGCVAVFG